MKKILFVSVVLALVFTPAVMAAGSDAILDDVVLTDVTLNAELSMLESAQMIDEGAKIAPKYLWIALIALILLMVILIVFEVRNNANR